VQQEKHYRLPRVNLSS